MLNGFLTLLKKFFCPLQETELSLKFSYYLMLLFENCTLASKFTDISLELQKKKYPSIINELILLESFSSLLDGLRITNTQYPSFLRKPVKTNCLIFMHLMCTYM